MFSLSLRLYLKMSTSFGVDEEVINNGMICVIFPIQSTASKEFQLYIDQNYFLNVSTLFFSSCILLAKSIDYTEDAFD